MPKKTRAQKIASARRSAVPPRTEAANRFPPPAKTRENFLDQSENQPQTDQDRKEYAYFLADLKKSLALIIIVIALEIVLYFASINGVFGNVR